MNMEQFGGSKIALVLGDSLIAIQRDDKPALAYAAMWDLPGGGREGSETAFECVAREVKEELGILVTTEDVVWERRYEEKLIRAPHRISSSRQLLRIR